MSRRCIKSLAGPGRDGCHWIAGFVERSGERRNAGRLLQGLLSAIGKSEGDLRMATDVLDPGADVHVQTCAELRFNKKVTTRRAWFEDVGGEVTAAMSERCLQFQG